MTDEGLCRSCYRPIRRDPRDRAPVTDPAGFISTRAAARTFGVTRHMLIQWASAGLITPAVTDGGGRHRWLLPQLRQQIATHLDHTPGRPEPGRNRVPDDHGCRGADSKVRGQSVAATVAKMTPGRRG